MKLLFNNSRTIRTDYKIRRRNIRPIYIPVGCQACGGPYPDCKDSCPIFDD